MRKMIAVIALALVGVTAFGCSSSSEPVTPSATQSSTTIATQPPVSSATQAPISPTGSVTALPTDGTRLGFSTERPQRIFNGQPDACGALAAPDEQIISCGIVPQPDGNRGGGYAIGTVGGGQKVQVSFFQYIGKDNVWAEDRVAQFDPNEFASIDATVFTATDGLNQLLVIYRHHDGSVDFDIVESLGLISAHDNALAVEVAGEQLQVWHSANQREDYVFAPGTGPQADPHWERVAVVDAPAPR